MNILATQYSLEHKALEIYLAGCNAPHCKGCHNPESWDFTQGTSYEQLLGPILTKITTYPDLVDNLFILGGEPLDQNLEQLLDLLDYFNKANENFSLNIKIWLFTGKPKGHPLVKFVRDKVDYLKCGPYLESKISDDNIQFGINLASSNQIILKTR